MPTIIRDRLAKVEKRGLAWGGHNRPSDGYCAMEAVAWIVGENFSDKPECVCPVIGAFMRNWNDGLSDDERNKFITVPLLLKTVGTRGSDALAERRSLMAADWLVRTHTPAWLRLAGLTAQADALSSLPEITAMAQIPSIRAPIEAAQRDAETARAAARAAAWAAAWAAAGDAAWDAAGAAAWAAAWAAAGDAAWDAAGAAAWGAAGAAAWAAAWAAAGDAAWDAAGDAARAAARAAAWAAAGDAARDAAGAAAWAAAWAAAGDAAWDAAGAAAWGAAGAAAWAAAWAAAGAAAWAAAGDAAWDAAGDAARAKLAPTKVELQASAGELILRMCEVSDAVAA